VGGNVEINKRKKDFHSTNSASMKMRSDFSALRLSLRERETIEI